MQIFVKKIPKLDFSCPNKNWCLNLKRIQFQHILRKNVQEVEKSSPNQKYEDKF